MLLLFAALLSALVVAYRLPERTKNAVRFELVLTWQNGAPDGFARKMIFVNGQFPGPPIFLHQGDDVEILVKNELPFPTAVHYHGIV